MSRGRYLVVAALFVLSLITYLDRAAISSAKSAISADLVISDRAMGAVFSAFALGYALAQIPAGWLADRFGPRLALSALVIAWSLFTAMTGFGRSVTQLLVARFLFGVAEAGAFPCSARAFFNWLHPGERGRANGIIFSGSRIGAAIAFPLMAWLLNAGSWRIAFYLLAIPGLTWALAWAVFFRDHPGGTAVAARAVESTGLSFGAILRSGPFRLAMVQYFASNFTFFICLSWMLPYLQERYRLSASEAAGYSMIPLLFGAVAHWTSGTLVDVLYRTGWKRWSRPLPGAFGFALATLAMLALTGMHSPITAVACFAIAAFGTEMTISPSWALCMDVGGTASGSVSGAMNMAGNFAAFVSANAFPYLKDLTGSGVAYFTLAATLNALGGFCWLRIYAARDRLAERGIV